MAGVGAAAAVLAPGLAVAGAPELSGRYRYMGGAWERAALDRAIEEATADMSVLVRRIARSRISDALDPRPTLDFEFAAGRVTLRSPGLPVLEVPLDGSAVEWTNQEDAVVTVWARLDGRTLRLRYVGDGGDTVCLYRFDGARVDFRTAVEHEQLPATLRYRLTYRRA